jgi:hypothetical protein
MTSAVKNLIPRKAAETSTTTQYTAINCVARIDSFTVTNTGTDNATISVYLVAAGGSAGSSNQVVKAWGVAPSEAVMIPVLTGQVINPSGFIATIASTAGLTISCNGTEIT